MLADAFSELAQLCTN